VGGGVDKIKRNEVKIGASFFFLFFSLPESLFKINVISVKFVLLSYLLSLQFLPTSGDLDFGSRSCRRLKPNVLMTFGSFRAIGCASRDYSPMLTESTAYSFISGLLG